MIPDRLSGSARRRRRHPATRLRLPLAVAAVALAVVAARVVEQRVSARTARAEGEEAFRRGDFVRAANRFTSALEIDPASTAVRRQLVVAYAETSAAALTQASGAILDAEARAGVLGCASAPEASGHPIPNDDLRRSLADRWTATIAQGIDAASKALAIDREHEGAMLALEAWHQLSADLAASSDEYRRHVIAADEWRHKALEVRRVNIERVERVERPERRSP